MLSNLLHVASLTTLQILFVGNSLLNYNELPTTVVKMLGSDGSKRTVVDRQYFVPHLENVPAGDRVDRDVVSGKFDVVVLQAAMVSSSRTRTYAQTRGIAMATGAKERGSRTLLYVEWARKGIDETEYTLNVYRGIAKASGAELLPVGSAWQAVHAKSPGFALWAEDGNHAKPLGSYLAACCVYFRIAGVKGTPTYVPAGLVKAEAQSVLEQCRAFEAAWLAKDGRGL